MPTYPELGKTAYNAELTRGRNAARRARNAASQMRNAGETTRLVLITEFALALAEIFEVFDNLDEIGRRAKNLHE